MAQGSFANGRNPSVPIGLFGVEVDAVIDTGFDGSLHLPSPLRLKLPVGAMPKRMDSYQTPFGLAGSVPIFDVEIGLAGRTVVLETIFGDVSEAMLGIEALQDCRLTVDFAAKMVDLTRLTP